MLSKKFDYIIIYSFLLASILCIAMLVRLFVVNCKWMNFPGWWLLSLPVF